MASAKASLLQDYQDQRNSSSLGHDEGTNDTLGMLVPTADRRRRACGLTTLFSAVKILGGIAALTMLACILHETHKLTLTLTQSANLRLNSPTDLSVSADKRCGRSPEEARSLNCRYDVMLGIWIHADCYDEDLMDTYLDNYNLTWYSDPALSDEVAEAEVLLGTRTPVFAERRLHFVHCGYSWDIVSRALAAGRPVIREIYNPGHTEHCTHMLVLQELHRNETKVDVA